MELILSRRHRRRDKISTTERLPSNGRTNRRENKRRSKGRGNETETRKERCGPYAPPPSTSQLGASPPMDSIAGLAAAPGTATWTKNSADWSSSFMVSCDSGVVFETNARVSVKQNTRASNKTCGRQTKRGRDETKKVPLPPVLPRRGLALRAGQQTSPNESCDITGCQTSNYARRASHSRRE